MPFDRFIIGCQLPEVPSRRGLGMCGFREELKLGAMVIRGERKQEGREKGNRKCCWDP